MRYALLATLATSLLWAPTATADDRPTSGDMSLISGRTLGNGETALAAGIGWPGIWAQATLAPSSTFNLGFRGTVLYGSPIMSFEGGVGGGLSVPLRFWMFGAGTLDVSIYVEPFGVAGQGSLLGEVGSFGNDLGFTGGSLGAVLAGAQVSDTVTIAFGLGGELMYVIVPDADIGDLVGTGLALLGLEALVARDTMLFVEVRGGIGFAPDRLFSSQEVVRASLGLAYLM